MRLRAKRDDLVAFLLPNLLFFEPNNFVVRPKSIDHKTTKKAPLLVGLFFGGCGRTRTADPYDVNVVL